MKNPFNANFSIYKVAKSNLYAAIPPQFLRLIRQYLLEYKDLQLIPADKEVKGILFSPTPHHGIEADNRGERAIRVNSLRFDD
jgi:hypothetical protein